MLDKSKVLEWLESEINSRWNHHDTRFGLLETKRKIEEGTFDAPLTEEVRQLREELETTKWSCIRASAWYEAHVEDVGRSANYWQSHYMKVVEQRDKLVKALEWYKSEGSKGNSDFGHKAHIVLSEIKGTET